MLSQLPTEMVYIARCIAVLCVSGRRAMEVSLVSTKVTATVNGTQPLLPRRGQATPSRARTGATPAASTRSRPLIGR